MDPSIPAFPPPARRLPVLAAAALLLAAGGAHAGPADMGDCTAYGATSASCTFACDRGNRIGIEARGLLGAGVVFRAEASCGGGAASCLEACSTWGSWAQWSSGAGSCEVEGVLVQVKCWAV